jgi:hypothetical protein
VLIEQVRDQVNCLSPFRLSDRLAALDAHAGRMVREREKGVFKVSTSGNMRCSEDTCFAVGRLEFVAQVYRVRLLVGVGSADERSVNRRQTTPQGLATGP